MPGKRKKPEETVAPPLEVPASLQLRPKTLVFISHDSRDADIAEAFANLLSDVSAGTLKSFRSSDKKGSSGIEFGAEWYNSIMSKLGDATDVVALLTQQSIDRPWILYEAGVAKGKLNTVVFGIAIGVPLQKVTSGPFGQFQNSGDDEDSLTKLVLQLLQRNPDASPREEAVRMQVRVFREKLPSLLQAPAPGPSAPAVDESSVAQLFEEVKVMVRDLPDKFESQLQFAGRRGPRRRVHPMMLEELLFHPSVRENPDAQAAGWLMFISHLRDDFPWLYEIGLDMYRALRSKSPSRISAARESFRRSFRQIMRMRASRELIYPEDEDSAMLMHQLPEMLEHFWSRIPLPAPERRAKKKE
ncbi:MAG TPA: toll/interleukin-1 receptor domain-containing protein [Thermoanaerobaculia bacterium]|jgi:hypothetical protein